MAGAEIMILVHKENVLFYIVRLASLGHNNLCSHQSSLFVSQKNIYVLRCAPMFRLTLIKTTDRNATQNSSSQLLPRIRNQLS